MKGQLWNGLYRVWERAQSLAYDVYERKLDAEREQWRLPEHIGIVMDGNRRFARAAGAQRMLYGHDRGADKLEEVLDWCEEVGVRVVTVWIFSIENFARSPEEVTDLMALFERKFRALVTHERIHRNEIQIRAVGRRDLLPEAVRKAIAHAEQATAHYERRVLNIGVAYGGREEILDAVADAARAADARGESLADFAETLDTTTVERHLYTAHVSDPDLIIRTSGEVRLSGFLLWQSAHAEYYFCDTHWPAFRRIDFLRALREYHQRHRRFGR